MNTAEIIKKVRKIEIHTTKLVNDLFGGEYQSVFKGQGIEFADVREYIPGDDIRTIDWNVTARSDKAFIKKYVEERELTVIFAVDMSGSQHFGSHYKLKSEIAAEITALLSFSAVKNNDKTGLLIFTDTVEKFIPVKKGKTHVLRVVREILGYKAKKRGTKIQAAAEFLSKVLSRTAVIFLISDFIDTDYEKSLKVLGQKHDVIAIQLKDPLEVALPSAGLVELYDAEKESSVLIDSSSKRVRKAFELSELNRLEKTDYLFKRLGMDKITILASESYVEPLIRFFKRREGKA